MSNVPPRICRRCQCGTRARLEALLKRDGTATQVLHGAQALVDVASADEVSGVMCAIVGAAGLPSALAAAQKGKTIYLANKETLVVSGALFMETARANGAAVLPVDSEHNAIFQVLPRDYTGRLNEHGIPFDYPDRFRRPVFNDRFRHVRQHYAHTSGQTPQLEHGAQNLRRFRHHDEQRFGAN